MTSPVGPVTAEIARSGYGASVAVKEVLVELFVSPVLDRVNSKTLLAESVLTVTVKLPTLPEPSGRTKSRITRS